MTLTPDQLKEVEEYSSKGLNGSDIALLMGVTEREFVAAIETDEYGPICTAYRKGIAITRAAIFEREILFASKGSPAAVRNYIENIATRQ